MQPHMQPTAAISIVIRVDTIIAHIVATIAANIRGHIVIAHNTSIHPPNLVRALLGNPRRQSQFAWAVVNSRHYPIKGRRVHL